MTFQVAVGLCIFAGALLFFAAGFLVARLLRRPPVPGPQEEPVSGAPAPAASAQAGGEGGLAKVFLDLLDADPRQESERKALAAELDNLRTELAEAGREIRRLRDAAADLAGRKDKLEKEKQELQARLQSSASTTARNAELAQKVSQLQQKLEAAEALRDENRRLAAELEAARSWRPAAVYQSGPEGTLEEENRKLSLQVRHLAGQVKEMHALREESRELKHCRRANKEMRSEIEALKTENAQLRSLQMLQETPPPPSASLPASGLGRSLQFLVNRLSESQAARGTALADELGLMVAGTGAHAEAMAGMAAVFSDIGATLNSMIPFGKIDHIQIANPNELTLTLRPVTISGHSLILSTLTAGEGPGRADVENLLKSAGSRA
jgi:hypothetical protein